MKALIFDLDDTIYPEHMDINLVNSRKELERLSKKYKIGILSNGRNDHVRKKIKQMGINYPFRSRHFFVNRKPLTFGLKSLLKELGVEKEEAIFVGNSWKSDVLCALFGGLKKIYLVSSNKKEMKKYLFGLEIEIIDNIRRIK